MLLLAFVGAIGDIKTILEFFVELVENDLCQ